MPLLPLLPLLPHLAGDTCCWPGRTRGPRGVRGGGGAGRRSRPSRRAVVVTWGRRMLGGWAGAFMAVAGTLTAVADALTAVAGLAAQGAEVRGSDTTTVAATASPGDAGSSEGVGSMGCVASRSVGPNTGTDAATAPATASTGDAGSLAHRASRTGGAYPPLLLQLLPPLLPLLLPPPPLWRGVLQPESQPGHGAGLGWGGATPAAAPASPAMAQEAGSGPLQPGSSNDSTGRGALASVAAQGGMTGSSGTRRQDRQ